MAGALEKGIIIMKMMKQIAVCLTAAVAAAALLGGCSDGKTGKDSGKYDKKEGLLQFSEIGADEEIAVMTVKGYGTIKLRFFPDKAPKAVQNFTTHVKEGYYDGLTFHRVIQDFMIQGGDPKGDGTGGESIWGEGFGIETSKNLRHFRGALAMAQSSMPNSIGSQFYIVQNDKVSAEELDYYEAQTGEEIPDEVREKYLEIGGVPSLDDAYTVFGQVIEGMDVVDKIAACKVTSNGYEQPSVPVDKIVIEKIVMQKYQQ